MAYQDAFAAASAQSATGDPEVDALLARYRAGEINEQDMANWMSANMDKAHLINKAEALEMGNSGPATQFDILSKLTGGPPDPAAWQKHNYAGTPEAYRAELQKAGSVDPLTLQAMNDQQGGRAEQMAGLDMLRRIATGEESAVRPELAAARDRLQRQALSQVASARGANRLAALRSGMSASGDAQAQLGAQGAAALAQERLAGMGAFSGAANALRGGDLGALGAMTQGELGRKQAYQGMYSTGLQDKAYQSSLDVDYASKVAGQRARTAEIAYQQSKADAAATAAAKRDPFETAAGVIGGLGGMATGIGSLIKSDMRAKTSIAPAPDMASELAPSTDPYAMDPMQRLKALAPNVRASLEGHARLPDEAASGGLTQDSAAGIGAMAGGLGQLLGAVRQRPRVPPVVSFSPSPSPFQLFSDERAKTKARPTSAIDDLLEHLRPYEYEYKPGMGPPGTRHGVMAQDMAKSAAGREAVVRDPQTGMLAIDVPSATSVSLAALADLGRRVKSLEGR